MGSLRRRRDTRPREKAKRLSSHRASERHRSATRRVRRRSRRPPPRTQHGRPGERSGRAASTDPPSAAPPGNRELLAYAMCLLTSLVISNMLTWLLPLNTSFSAASALIIRLFFLS